MGQRTKKVEFKEKKQKEERKTDFAEVRYIEKVRI
jgi:hypothetical protein